MKEEDKFSREEILKESFGTTEEASEYAQRRRGIVKTVLAGIAALPLLSKVSVARQMSESEKRVQNLHVARETAQQKVENAPSELLDALSEDDLISEPYVTSFPYHRMDDQEALGGIERVQIDGDRENILVHKPTNDGGRLSLLLPVTDGDASAEYFPKDEGRIISYYVSRDGQVRKQSRDVQAQATCDDRCTRCCSYCKPSALEEREPCPNCWIGSCKTVSTDCDGCDCSNYPSDDCVPP